MDEVFIRKTFELAKKGLGWTSPNPLVGAVLVKNRKIVSTGFHKKFGGPHAEVEAIKNLKEDPANATLYVSLEPCSHFGKTPPCADLIIKSGIKKVVCATKDPNPINSGVGIRKLKQAGIEVRMGILEKEAEKLNEAFFTFHIKKRPFVVVKFAASLDGKIATHTKDSRWITSEKSRDFVHRLRGRYQAILVGINTILLDDPHLGARIKGLKDPLRIILDPKLKIPLNSQVLRDENVLIVTAKTSSKEEKELLKEKGINILTFPEEKILIKDLLKSLAELDIISVLIEGGSKTLGNFVDAKLVDKVYVFFGPLIIGGENAVPAIGGMGTKLVSEAMHLENPEIQQFDNDFLIWGYTR